MDNNYDYNNSENPFGMSIGDLMAALLLIFVLLLCTTLLRLKEQHERQSEIATSYNEIKRNLYDELYFTFKDDLSAWDAEIDSVELVIRFKEPSMLFDYNQSVIKPQFKDILTEFFPRYIQVLNSERFRDNIEEIRIEGHTDSSGDYFYNMKLSQDRTRSVLEYGIGLLSNQDMYNWVIEKVTANGLSSSKPILDFDGKENMDASRRVEFRVKTDAEKKIDEIINSEKS
ncbi:MAG: OmpA family protein [Tannerellaceae bacterium]